MGADGTVDLDKLTAEFAKSDVKQFEGRGKKMFSYLAGETVIKRLNEATGNHWDMTVEAIWSDTMTDGATLMFARVRLTLPGCGSREHIGVQVIRERDGEDMYKGAITDALKKAATLFGVGLELYEDEPKAASQQPGASRPAQRQGQPTPIHREPPAEESSGPWTPPADVQNTAHLVGILNKHYGWTIKPDAKLSSILDDLHEEYGRDPSDVIPFDKDDKGNNTRYPSTVWRWLKERATPAEA
jgi:hypothetical protein